MDDDIASTELKLLLHPTDFAILVHGAAGRLLLVVAWRGHQS